jgi:RNA polymerase sigma-70 factor, ECF subfamily
MEINELVGLAKSGNAAAFEELYSHFAKRIFCFIRIKIQNRQDAEDVLQEVFIKSYKGLGSLRPGKLNFSAWLFKITSNTINDYFRRKYRNPEIVAIDEDFDLPDNKSLYNEIEAKSDLETAQENLKKLTVPHRKVIELRFFQQLSVNEVAKTLNKSNLAIRMLQYRAKKALKYIAEESRVGIKMNSQAY